MVAVVIVIDVEPAPTAAATGATAPPAAAPAAPSNVSQGGTKTILDPHIWEHSIIRNLNLDQKTFVHEKKVKG